MTVDAHPSGHMSRKIRLQISNFKDTKNKNNIEL